MQFDLHGSPHRLDHRIVVPVADGSHGVDEAGIADALGEGPGCELRIVLAVVHGFHGFHSFHGLPGLEVMRRALTTRSVV